MRSVAPSDGNIPAVNFLTARVSSIGTMLIQLLPRQLDNRPPPLLIPLEDQWVPIDAIPQLPVKLVRIGCRPDAAALERDDDLDRVSGLLSRSIAAMAWYRYKPASGTAGASQPLAAQR